MKNSFVKNMVPIPNFEEYLINENGEVYSIKTKKFLKSWKDSKGYLQIQLYKNNKKYCFKIHRIVASLFVSNPYNYPEVNHKDEDKANPKACNLEWCTSQYNSNYGTRNKRVSESNKQSLLRLRKLIYQLDLQGNIVAEFSSIEKVKEFGFNQPNVVAVLKHRRKTTGGFRFVYKEECYNEIP